MGKDLSKVSTTFYFCDGGSCRRAGSEQVVRAARAHLRNIGLWDTTHTIRTRCNGRCEDAPTCIVHTGNYWYKELSATKIKRILESHIFESKPSEQDLMYTDGYAKVLSKKERPQILPKPFRDANDEDWGACWKTKGFSSDQYLYPLFLFLLETKGNTIFEVANGASWTLNQLKCVDYSHDYQLTLMFEASTVTLNIGSVPKTENLVEQQAKITGIFYFISKKTDKKKLYFKNKLGETVAKLYLSPNEVALWDYLVKIQLKGIAAPE